ncbi:MAG TPA: chemotaxis protein CheW, partial [Candidatus Methanoperedens sp.]|nr:chemotaxis protein CheW [Candidatus Methanoperedens sp.]
ASPWRGGPEPVAPETLAARGEQVRLLFFRAGGERFALDVTYVREILAAREVTPVPFVPDTVAGIVNHRGTIFTLIRFARLAGLAADEPGGIALLRLPEMSVGLLVERIEGIERVPGLLLAAGLPEGAPPPAAPFVRRAADAQGRFVHAVDADVLIDTIYQLPGLVRAGEA